MKRTHPLIDVEGFLNVAIKQFELEWEKDAISGWVDHSTAKAAVNGHGSGIWCPYCRSNKDALRNSFLRLKIITGQKSYAKQTVYDAHLTSKKHIKAEAKQQAADTPIVNPNGSTDGTSQPTEASHSAYDTRKHSAALQTHLCTEILKRVLAVLTETKSNVERRFSLTAREREQELLDQAKPAVTTVTNAQGDVTVEEEEEEERIYNPLKLPMGWDGKPIPYWLFKLHGLGVEYRCEICSDHLYMGR